MNKPYLVVVTGPPGTGKSTLVHRLADQTHCLAFSRDEFKEGYVTTSGRSHSDLGRQINADIYQSFFDAVEFLLAKGISLVIEAAFQHKLWQPKLSALQSVCHLSIVLCSVDQDLAQQRILDRGRADVSREYFHGDPAVAAVKQGLALPKTEYQPPKLDVPTLVVDTSDGYRPDLLGIAEFTLRKPSQD